MPQTCIYKGTGQTFSKWSGPGQKGHGKKEKTYYLKLKALRCQATAAEQNKLMTKVRLWRIINRKRKSGKYNENSTELEINCVKTKSTQKVSHHLNIYFSNIANDILIKYTIPESAF